MSNHLYYKIKPQSISLNTTTWMPIGNSNLDTLGNLFGNKDTCLFVITITKTPFSGDLSFIVELNKNNNNNNPFIIFINTTTWVLLSIDNRTPYQQDPSLYQLGAKINTGTLSCNVSFTKLGNYNTQEK